MFEADIKPGYRIKLGGMVKTGSIIRNGTKIKFIATDFVKEVYLNTPRIWKRRFRNV